MWWFPQPRNYQPAGSGLAPSSYRPPTTITAVSHYSQADRPPRWIQTQAGPDWDARNGFGWSTQPRELRTACRQAAASRSGDRM